jgi:formylglycine-generating enzyme required for sulfatase activity
MCYYAIFWKEFFLQINHHGLMKKTKYLKPGLLFLSLALFLATASRANNIIVDNVSLTGQNTVNHTTSVRFDISWENSWRTSTAPNNWDAAWVFIKFRIGSGSWHHATLNSANHIAPAGSTISAPVDNTGIFLYRSTDGSGTFSLSGVKLGWDYAFDGVVDNDVVDIKVFAIEMVYVPQGAFYVGSGGSEVAHFYSYPTSTSPYYIDSENEITVGTTPGNLYYATSSNSGDALGPVPAAYPKGYKAIYVMKYEISQIAYVDFLNVLTRSQQNARTSAFLGSGTSSVTNRFVMVTLDAGSNGYPTPERRSGIRCDAVIDPVNPITFYCDLNANNIPNEIDDGQDISCVYLSWADAMAYLDWAGLRPMTELEYEKACRGTLYPVANEQVWGVTAVTISTGLLNSGRPDEISSVSTANCTCNNGILGPTRGGMYAKAGSSRLRAGATYYGILDMGGNLWERPVTLGNPEGRSFTGLHGDGNIDASGNADVPNWPSGATGIGSGFRGGYWASTPYSITHVSDRSDGAHGTDRRRERFGGRGIRTSL